jgi:hypothetical protein
MMFDASLREVNWMLGSGYLVLGVRLWRDLRFASNIKAKGMRTFGWLLVSGAGGWMPDSVTLIFLLLSLFLIFGLNLIYFDSPNSTALYINFR